MTSSAFASLLTNNPFRPFTLVVGDDQNVHVSRLCWVRHESGSRIVTILREDGRDCIIDLECVTMIKVEPEKKE